MFSHPHQFQGDAIKIRPKFRLTTLFILCACFACGIASVVWLRNNAIIRSEAPGTLVARNDLRFPTNRWFRMEAFNPTVFETHRHDALPNVYNSPHIEGMRDYPLLETDEGMYRVDVDVWRYEGSGPHDFRVELTVQLGDPIE